jgi:hypothetical protein
MAERSLGFDLQQMKALEALGLSATAVADLQTSVTNLNAWATALATKLNADAGVTDVNYDITPQA